VTPDEAGALAADEALDAYPGELPADLTPEEARVLTDETVALAAGLWDNVRRLYLGRAWRALGYGTWDDYCSAELRGRIALPREERPAVVRSLRESGLTTRAIAAAVGVSVGTAHGDVSAGVQNRTPAVVTGRDGKRYPATVPSRYAVTDPGPAAVAADLAARDGGYAARARRTQGSGGVGGRPLTSEVPGVGPAVADYLEREEPGLLERMAWRKAFRRAYAALPRFFAEWEVDVVVERLDPNEIEHLLRLQAGQDAWYGRLRAARDARPRALHVVGGGE
jgi:hypothetical protein